MIATSAVELISNTVFARTSTLVTEVFSDCIESIRAIFEALSCRRIETGCVWSTFNADIFVPNLIVVSAGQTHGVAFNTPVIQLVSVRCVARRTTQTTSRLVLVISTWTEIIGFVNHQVLG